MGAKSPVHGHGVILRLETSMPLGTLKLEPNAQTHRSGYRVGIESRSTEQVNMLSGQQEVENTI